MSGYTIVIDNPFKICHDKVCDENITTYEFKKEQSYEINVKVIKVKDIHNDTYVITPGFTFCDVQYNGTYWPDDIDENENSANGLKTKLLFISLILLLL